MTNIHISILIYSYFSKKFSIKKISILFMIEIQKYSFLKINILKYMNFF